MALSFQLIYDGVDVKEWWVHLQGADTSGALEHGFAAQPIVSASPASDTAYAQAMYVRDIDGTSIFFDKSAGGKAATLLVFAAVPGAYRFG